LIQYPGHILAGLGRLLSSSTVGSDAGIEFEQTSEALKAEKQKSLNPEKVT
jgi:hypothetical protein